MARFMVAIGDENFQLLSLEARDRGITIQELIRAVIVPDWFSNNNASKARPDSGLLQMPALRQRSELTILNRSDS